MRRFVICLLILTTCFCGTPMSAQTTDSIIKPTKPQLIWSESEIGVIFHYDLHVFDQKRYNQSYNRLNPISDYNMFNPRRLDTDQWLSVAKSAGAKFAILTVTHETGFALYQSDVNPFCLKALKWRDGKGDILRDFVNSCRRYGLLPGIYIGIRWNSRLGVSNFKVNGDPVSSKIRQEWYKHYCERFTQELLSSYGKLFIVWFDGGADDPTQLGPDVEPLVKKYQPDCLFYHNVDRADIRWGGSETGTVEDPCWSTFPTRYSHNKTNESHKDYLSLLKHGDPNGKYWMPAMADTPLRGYNNRHEWFWEPGDANAVYPLDNLVAMYYKSVGRNATLVLGLTPNEDGLIPRVDSLRLRSFGHAIKQLTQNPIVATSGQGCLININLTQQTIANQAIIQEDVSQGQRVRHYLLQAFVTGRWTTIYEGQSIGNKHICLFPNIKTAKFRLVIDRSIAPPIISNFSIYNSDLERYRLGR